MTTERKQQLDMLAKFFNMKAGTHCWGSGSKETVQVAEKAFDLAGDNTREIKDFLREYAESGKKDLRSGLMKYINKKLNERGEEPAEAEVDAEEVPEVKAQPVDNLTASINFMGQVVMDLLARTKLDEIRDTVGAALQDDVRKFIADNYGPITRKVSIELPERKVELKGVVHSKFEQVLKYVMADEPVFLTGPAGSGKNVLCQQIAKTLGLNFYFTNAVTQEYKLTGFTDANGTFHESQFYKAFKNGGVFMLDEMDASIPEVLIILNAALANRYFDFPAPIGYVEAHKDFRVIAAGNTFGNGADYEYVGRNQLDAASLDRFALVRIDYDPRIEEACANGDMELLEFCRAFRKATAKAGIRTVVSYRAISRMAKLSACMDAEELLDNCLIKSLEADDLNAIRNELPHTGKWTTAFVKLQLHRDRT